MTVQNERRWFGTDGIRGTANETLTVEIATKLGQAAGVHFRRGEHRHSVLIAKDPRRSGYMFEYALVAGFTSVGMDVWLTGPLPTPAVAMLTRSMRADLGVMISASHNLFEDNGIKLFGPDGSKLSDAVECEIERLMRDSDLSKSLARGAEIGRADRIDGAQDRYIEYAKSTLPKSFEFKDFRIVIDCANGAAYHVAPRVLKELGADVITIGNEPNGLNINLNCGSTSPEALTRKVRETRANIGIALDGDADRLVLVDETGRVVSGDQVLAFIATAWKSAKRLKSPQVVATELANLGLERHLAENGITLIRSNVGDRYVIEEMRTNGCNFGGESSGHIVMTDYNTTGDGLVAALQCISLLNGRKVSEALHCFDPLPQIVRNVRFKGVSPLQTDEIQRAIAAARSKLEGMGRLVVRTSGTEPLIRIMGEGDDSAIVAAIVNDLAIEIENAL